MANAFTKKYLTELIDSRLEAMAQPNGNGLQGTYTIGQRGEFTAKAGPQRLIGCDNVPHTAVLQGAKRIALDADTLKFFAADGRELASYARAR